MTDRETCVGHMIGDLGEVVTCPYNEIAPSTAPSIPQSPAGEVDALLAYASAIPRFLRRLADADVGEPETEGKALRRAAETIESLIARIDGERAAREALKEILDNDSEVIGAVLAALESGGTKDMIVADIEQLKRERLTEKAARRIADDAVNRFGLRLSDGARLAGMILAARGGKE